MSAPIELALAAWGRNHPDTFDRERAIEDALELGETGTFSVRQIVAITGCPWDVAREQIEKSSKKGGKLEPQSLDAVYAVWLEIQQGGRPAPASVRHAVDMGCGTTMLARLTDQPPSNIYWWLARA